MIKKQKKLVITFQTTTTAMAMETACKKENIPGRLIPIPKSISAGCGLAWYADPSEEEMLAAFMKKEGITPQEMTICMI